jgi:hypothetical protein
MLWKQSLTDASLVLDKDKYPKIQVSYDMAWQQRNSGNQYNSASGHALLVGATTRKPVMLTVKSKICGVCAAWKRKMDLLNSTIEEDEEDFDIEAPPHPCPKNHEGSSAAMEPLACLEMVISLYDKYCVTCKFICIDDDASTRAMLSWSNADYMINNNTTEVPLVPKTKGINKGKLQRRKDKGRLPGHIPEPTFVADPNHRRKVLTGELIELANSKVAVKCTMTKMDAVRIGKGYGYMIRTLHALPITEYENAASAVLEHHFDNHQYCGAWCPRKNQSEAVRILKARYYRNKNDKHDKLLYDVLKSKMERFCNLERLQEVAHGLDTQPNESFNNMASWFAPKNKVYCSSMSLSNRLSVALGINCLGLEVYFKRLYKELGILMPEDVMHFFDVKDMTRAKRLLKRKTKEQKKSRLQGKHEKLREYEAIAKTERSKRDGTYKTGMNMADESDEEGNKKPAATTNAAAARRRIVSNLVCPHCKRKGHKTTRSKHCLLYNGRPKNVPEAATASAGCTIANAARNQLNGAVEDVDNFDAFPLTDDPPSDLSFSAFHDAGTWDDSSIDDCSQRGVL